MNNKINLALLAGGISGEREVSLNTGEQIFNALNQEKYNIIKYDPRDDMNIFIEDCINKKIDVVFPALHGPYGEDGKLQGMLDILNIPYVYSGCLSSAIAMDKYKTKIIASSLGLFTLGDTKINKKIPIKTESLIELLSLPIVIKPIDLGSSVGVNIAKTAEEIRNHIDEAFKYSEEILLEKFIKGRELTATILENNGSTEVLPILEIVPKTSEWYDYRAKYEKGASEKICPAQIPENIKKQIQHMTIKIFNELQCKDLARVDFIWPEADNKIYFLEINTIPGMTSTSLAPESAKAAGISFSELLDIIIQNNFKQK